MEIKVETGIHVSIDGDEVNLTREEAEQLYNQLKTALGKQDFVYVPYYPITTPWYPNNPWTIYSTGDGTSSIPKFGITTDQTVLKG